MPHSDVRVARQLGPVRILLVEDEPIVRFVMAEALRDLAATVIEASTADEAWEYLTSGAAVDVVFTDHRLPGSLTGAQLARRIRQQFPALPVVVTSANFDEHETFEERVGKPYDIDEIATRLVQLATSARGKGTEL